MKRVLREWVFSSAQWLGSARISSLLAQALGEAELALCLHRVSAERRGGELLPKLTIAPGDLDALIERLLASRPRGGRWLTVSFDDGYRDAAEYVLERAPRYPEVEWLFFVCPEKIEQQVGFRWDWVEAKRARGETVDLREALDAPARNENARPELRAVAQRPEFALADVELCRKIAALPNAALGNHTNSHRRLSRLDEREFEAELEASTRDFERLFGPMRHFAYPFGTPGVDFGPEQVRSVRARGAPLIWSTEPRFIAPGSRRPGALLPRMVIDGNVSVDQLALLIASRALKQRVTPARRQLELQVTP